MRSPYHNLVLLPSMLLCLLLSYAKIGAQNASEISRTGNNQYVIKQIKLSGIKKTKESYLRQFIQSKVGKELNSSTSQKDIQQLNRRTGVANTELVIDTLDQNSVNLNFIIREQRTLLPQFGLGGIKNNFWWQVGIAEHNLFGKGQTLIATYLSNDKKPNGKLFYQNEWIKGSPWGMYVDFAQSGSIEPLYFKQGAVEYNYANTGVGAGAHRNFGFNHRLTAGVNFFSEKYNKVNVVNTDSNSPGPDNVNLKKLLFKLNFEVNQLSYDYFYRTGSQWNILVQSVTTLKEQNKFISVAFEGKKYWRPYKTGNIALRLRAALATNRDSPFAPFVLDSRVNIRGVGNRVDRGTAQLVLNLEFRQTVFHIDKWAGQVVVFSDSGTWRHPGSKLNELFDPDVFQHFIGGGIRFINKKVFQSTIRLDYGIDLWDTSHSGPVLGIGQYF